MLHHGVPLDPMHQEWHSGTENIIEHICDVPKELVVFSMINKKCILLFICNLQSEPIETLCTTKMIFKFHNTMQLCSGWLLCYYTSLEQWSPASGLQLWDTLRRRQPNNGLGFSFLPTYGFESLQGVNETAMKPSCFIQGTQRRKDIWTTSGLAQNLCTSQILFSRRAAFCIMCPGQNLG